MRPARAAGAVRRRPPCELNIRNRWCRSPRRRACRRRSPRPAPGPWVISHRTNAGTMPENTLAGIRAAIAERADMVELDVQVTADGTLVLMHDRSLRRTTGDPRSVSELTARELRALRVRPTPTFAAAEPVPTLAEAIAELAGRCRLLLDLKAPGLERPLAALLRSTGAVEWAALSSEHPAELAAMREVMPELPLGLSVGLTSICTYGFEGFAALATAAGASAVGLQHQLLRPEAVATAHARSLAIYAWTVDGPAEIDWALSTGVDAICTNFPPRVFEARGGRRARLRRHSCRRRQDARRWPGVCVAHVAANGAPGMRAGDRRCAA
ncbi:MAG: glycerophosphodiester phosphodiesterase [Dehalococcoidia bacterium]|nr:glycerophosphodiester phosphodiesterase [Dehalococcoidia bacterium]